MNGFSFFLTNSIAFVFLIIIVDDPALIRKKETNECDKDLSKEIINHNDYDLGGRVETLMEPNELYFFIRKQEKNNFFLLS